MKTLVILAALSLAAPTLAHADEGSTKNKWVAAGLNFVLPGTGYIYNGEKPLYVTVPMVAGAIALTYVENFHEFEDGQHLLDHDKTAFGVLFGAVFVINTALAIDAYQEAKAINARRREPALGAWRVDVRSVPASRGSGYGVTLGRSF